MGGSLRIVTPRASRRNTVLVKRNFFTQLRWDFPRAQCARPVMVALGTTQACSQDRPLKVPVCTDSPPNEIRSATRDGLHPLATSRIAAPGPFL